MTPDTKARHNLLKCFVQVVHKGSSGDWDAAVRVNSVTTFDNTIVISQHNNTTG